ncbi:ligand-gated channel protein [Rhodoferax lacus]|uniref:Ligand-gated channel protein n=1 Tax=Rhodoferax lacus TaxID=2184758 RepID=A0A3E1R9N4_9BURK|nr:TonB-dependent receptor [Rhodoferax lacus]RFO96065.1 ligand-gated channel protein [Rhodoferax lacus]
MFTTCKPTLLVHSLSLLGVLSAFPAAAQSLNEVVVSASRSEQRSFDAPAAVQSVARETIQGAGPQVNLSESLGRVPGLTILDRQNYAQDLQVSIRGFGARSAFGIRGIRLLIDGIPATTPDGQGQGSSISLTSTDRIEVLRGPMALLYGNSSGGVIQAFSKAAPKEPELGYQYYVGSYGLHRADYQFGDTLGTVGIMADYSTFTIDGYRANSFTERKQFNTKIGFDASEQLHVNVVFNQFDMPLAQDPVGLTRTQLNRDPSQAGTNAISAGVRKVVLQNQLGSSATYTVDQERSFTGRAYYGTRENLQYQAAGNWIGLNRAYFGVGLQYNQRAVWSGTPVDWAAGYEFDRSREYRQAGSSPIGQKSGSPTRSEDNQSENSDLFAQGTALLSDVVSVSAGVRQSTVRFTSEDYYPVSSGNPDGTGNVSYQATNPVLGLTFHASDSLNLYANYGKGFETPTLAEMAYKLNPSNPASAPVGQFNTTLNASSSQHYELGAKWVPNASSRIDLALYQVNTVDELVAAKNTNGQIAYINAPGTSRTGWELSGSTQLTPHLSFNASASMIDASYSQRFTTNGVTIASGNKLPGIPQSSLFSELAWTSEATPAKASGLRLGVEMVQAGRIYANDLNTESADGRTVFNLSASQRWGVGKGALTLYGRLNNVSDEKYVGSVIVNQASSQFYEPGLPQNWTLGLSLNLPI